MSEFWKLYRHPEWQRKRLEVMEYAHFLCQQCGEGQKTLNVHHTYYLRDHKPWEYPTEALQCLCEPCHEVRTKAANALKLLIGELGNSELEQVMGYVKGLILSMRACPHDESRFSIHSYEEAVGVADTNPYGRGKDAERVIMAMDDASTISHADLNALFNPKADKGDQGK